MINHNEETSMDLMSNDHRIKSVLGRLEMIIDNENDNIGKDPSSISKSPMPIKAVASMS